MSSAVPQFRQLPAMPAMDALAQIPDYAFDPNLPTGSEERARSLAVAYFRHLDHYPWYDWARIAPMRNVLRELDKWSRHGGDLNDAVRTDLVAYRRRMLA